MKHHQAFRQQIALTVYHTHKCLEVNDHHFEHPFLLKQSEVACIIVGSLKIHLLFKYLEKFFLSYVILYTLFRLTLFIMYKGIC